MNQPDHVTRFLPYQNFQIVKSHFCKKCDNKLKICESKWNALRQVCLVINVYNYKKKFLKKCFSIIMKIYDQPDL